MFYFNMLKNKFFSKFFIVNKKIKFNTFRGLKSLIIQKLLRYKSEDTLNMTYNVKLIENLSGFKPNITKIIFRSFIKKKKNISILLQINLHSFLRVISILSVISVYILKFSKNNYIPEKDISPNYRLKNRKKFLTLKIKDFSYLFADSLKMMEHAVENYKFFDLLLIFTFSNKHTLLFKNSFFRFVKLFLKLN